MTLNHLQKLALGLAGITSLGIGVFILASPHAFYSSYGITLGSNASLLSELRAPGAGLAAFGAIMLTGIVRPALAQAAVVAALTVFLAFPVGRLVGLVADGPPSTGILAALVLEVAIAAVCVFAFLPRRESTLPDLSAQ